MGQTEKRGARMTHKTPWITEPFTPEDGNDWQLYVDESGTEQESPVTVVFGVLMNPRMQAAAQVAIAAATLGIPTAFRSHYTPPHASSLMKRDKHSDTWTLAERWNLIRSVAAIPHAIGAMSFSAYVKRSNPSDPTNPEATKEDFHYAYAFGLCVAHANRFVTEHLGATAHFDVRSENMDNKWRKKMAMERVRALNLRPHPLPDVKIHQIAETPERRLLSAGVTPGWNPSAERLGGDVEFIPSTEPLLSLADTGAYCVRRYLIGAARAEELVATIGGNAENLRGCGVENSYFGTMLHFSRPKPG